MKLCTALFVASLLALPGAAYAQLNKCVGTDGKVTYQGDPCPTDSKAGSVKAPPPGSPSTANDPAPGPAKEGWDEARLARMQTACVTGSMRESQANWGKTDPNAGPFPQDDYRESLEPFCTCVLGRIRTSMTPAEYDSRGAAVMTRFTAEALQGGPCRPSGILGRLVKE